MVIDNASGQKLSDTDLVISYAQLNPITDPDDETGNTPPGTNGPLGFYAFPVRHVDSDGSGGYVWKMTTHFKTFTNAEASFIRAMNTWRCQTNINWTIGETVTGSLDVEQYRAVNDNTNIITFDNSNSLDPLDDLPDGVLGRCTSYYSACGTGGLDFDWFVEELDIVFDDEINWGFGPANTTGVMFDFESVVLHELGHGHQLGHVIEPNGSVMHFSISNGSNIRTLTIGDEDGAQDVQVRSESGVRTCFGTLFGVSSMSSYNGDCNLSINDLELSDSIEIFPNPSNGEFFIKNSSSIVLEKAVLFDIRGKQLFEYQISNNLSVNSFRIASAANGIYFIKIFSKEGSVTRKIMQK